MTRSPLRDTEQTAPLPLTAPSDSGATTVVPLDGTATVAVTAASLVSAPVSYTHLTLPTTPYV